MKYANGLVTCDKMYEIVASLVIRWKRDSFKSMQLSIDCAGPAAAKIKEWMLDPKNRSLN